MREVLEKDDQGRELVVVYRETPREQEERRAEREEQAQRAREIEESLRTQPTPA